MKEGDIIGSFVLTKQITSFTVLHEHLYNSKSIFARHKMYPTSFIIGWPYKVVCTWLNAGCFWETKRIKK